MSLFRAFSHRPFALLWSGQTISRIGDFLYEVALAWWVLDKTGSAALTSLVLILTFTPMLLFLLIGGVAVDRFSRINIMLASDVARGLIVGGVAALAYTNQLEVWHIYLASLAFGFMDAFFQPAFQALVPELTPQEHLTSANALSSFSVQIGRMIGPAIGGTVLGVLGAAGAFALNATSFLISAVFLLPLWRMGVSKPQPAAPTDHQSFLNDARDGLTFVLERPVLWISILLFAFTNITLVGPYSVAMPVLVKNSLDGNADMLGWIYAVFPVGYVAGGLWTGRQIKVRRRGIVAYGGTIVAGLMLGSFGLLLPLWAMFIAAFINGAALEIGTQIWLNLLQELVPAEKMGRVSSIDMLGSFVLLPIGLGLAGWATDVFGAPRVFLLGGGLTAVFTVCGLLHPALRQLD